MDGKFAWGRAGAVRFFTKLYIFCGGTLITKQWVVTAAHCLGNGGSYATADLIGVGLSAYELSETKDLAVVDQVIVHREFDATEVTGGSDIALLHLAEDAIDEPILGWVGKGDPESLAAAGETGKVLGFGVTDLTTFATSDILQEVDVPILSDNECEFGENLLCAGNPEEGGKDACSQDSGGPFVVDDLNGNPVLAGIVSFGEPCALPKKPGYYTRVSSFAGEEWMD